ncbi:MAG: HD domain-containing protein, partial [Candidatus Diapherotrites archaeon]|nr:HD domain-containing protein [Candidatus Diapherotrites archaeon]
MALSFEHLVKKVVIYNPSFDTDKFKHSLELLKEKDQKHPSINKNFYELGLEFLDVLVDLNMDSETLYAGALYYPFVHNKITHEEVKKISEELIPILDKLKKYRDYELSMQSKEDMQKLILAMTKDPRIIIIRLAKHLLYLRERDNETPEQRKTYAQASFDIYTPIAHKLGMHSIKSEIEDLSFKELESKTYNEIQSKLEKLDRETQIIKVKAVIENELEKAGIKAQVYGRPKHIYSIWK